MIPVPDAADVAADAIADGAVRLGLGLPAGAPRALAAYLALLAKWNKVHNLTAIREPDRMVTHHVLDSLSVLPALAALGDPLDGARVLDIGSGGGVPGIPLAIARPDWHVTLCEPSHKKSAFLAQAAAELPLPNVDVAASRAEDLRAPQPYRIVVSRAFSDLDTFAQAALPHLAARGLIVAMKGVLPQEELSELPAGIEVVATPALAVPGLEATRHLIVMKPRGTA
jgi:16S rRNA (guanine527-N7)-methyltransferase